ncbi:MAG: cation:proton antiporter [Acidimicrobiales bacterium]
MELDEIAAFVFLDIAVIMLVARAMGALFKRIRQPAVVGEIIAGIMLGPTLLGAFPGNLPSHLFPTDVRPFLNILAQLGLVIFMFIVGLELDMKLIRGNERIAAVISVASITLPFSLGFVLAAVLHGGHDIVRGEQVDFLPFALFIGASMSITAFPVLARILTERGMYRTPIGALTLACAAVDDIIAWSLLAVVVAVVESTGVWDLPRILLMSIGFVTLMFAVVRPRLDLLVKRYREAGRLTPGILSVILLGLLFSAFATSKIGIHSIFGAFLFGTVLPREGTADLFHDILEKLEQVSVLLLLPVFFIATGLGVDASNLGLGGLGELALILLVACAGKFLGAAAGARAQGLPSRKAAAIGVLMNTRGLTELVILNIGVSKGVLDGELFTLLVVMAVFTTVITEPILRIVYPDKLLNRDIAEAERAALGIPDAFRVLVLVSDPVHGGGLVDRAIELLGAVQPAEVVLTRFRPFAATGIEVGGGLGAELAEMAGSLEAMNTLARQARDRGVACAVLSQFSDDVVRDLAAQAVTVEADIVLIGRRDGDAGLVAAASAAVPCALVVATVGRGGGPGPGRPVVVAGGAGPDAEAALETAARTAHGSAAELRIVVDQAGRRLAGRMANAVTQLRKAGIDAAVVQAARGSEVELANQVASGGLVVLAASASTGDEGSGDGRPPATASGLADLVAAPLLTVRAGGVHDSSDLARLLEKLAKPASPVGAADGAANGTVADSSGDIADEQTIGGA